MPTYQTVLTASGRAKLAAAVSSQIPVVLTVGAVGDGNGFVPEVLDTRTELVNEVWRGDLASVLVDPADVSKVQAEILIPAEDGGFTIRELGIYDSSGDLFAYGSFAPSYKSRISEGMGSVKTIQTIFTVTSSEYITFDVAPSTESASKSYVDASVAALRTTLLSAMRTDDAAVKDFARKLVDAVFPVGSKLEWPASSPPPVIEGIVFLKQNGGSFDTLSYPKLAAIFPDGVLPDTRGYASRHWDDGKGIDPGRVLMSTQADAMRELTGSFAVCVPENHGLLADGVIGSTSNVGTLTVATYNVAGPSTPGYVGASDPHKFGYSFQASRQVPVAAEFRMKNIAYNWLVRAS